MKRVLVVYSTLNWVDIYESSGYWPIAQIAYNRIPAIIRHYTEHATKDLWVASGTRIYKTTEGELVLTINSSKSIKLNKEEAVLFISDLKDSLEGHKKILADIEAESNKPTLEERVAALEQKLLALETNVPVLQL